ncbi:hypothetical protein SCHIN_v1c10180 [Spiroplasma chinense]|uniref:J domain-containing protein n=1 Tax=Spiroplasma chinense TaxID=216932 RepID=A0A5B9Y593_9MOLU|nr:DnaJ domain-containing protein [Spiroplasma chinense]QEH62211.1 hypothetical protein SCHIN_v1c10180 [Spiroplasma chinense]
MEDLFRLLGRLLNFLLFFFIIDMFFNRGRSRARNYGRFQQNSEEGHEEQSSQSYWSNSASHIDEAYSALGATRAMSDNDIKKLYRKLAKKYHPDVNNSLEAQAEMTKINNAYETIMESRKVVH